MHAANLHGKKSCVQWHHSLGLMTTETAVTIHMLVLIRNMSVVMAAAVVITAIGFVACITHDLLCC